MISLINSDFQWGRSEVVIIYPDRYILNTFIYTIHYHIIYRYTIHYDSLCIYLRSACKLDFPGTSRMRASIRCASAGHRLEIPSLGDEVTNYPLVNCHIAMENHHAINGKTHYFYDSMAMFNSKQLVYQRVRIIPYWWIWVGIILFIYGFTIPNPWIHQLRWEKTGVP